MSDQEFKADLVAALPNLRAFALSLCGTPHQADDLVQETMVKAWSNRTSFTPGTNMRAWLFTILRNSYFSILRKQKNEMEDADGTITDRLATLPEQYGRLDISDFQAAFAKLSDDQREAIVLITVEGFSYEEAAEIAGCAVGTIKSRVNRARARLAQALDITATDDFGPDMTSQAVVRHSQMVPTKG